MVQEATQEQILAAMCRTAENAIDERDRLETINAELPGTLGTELGQQVEHNLSVLVALFNPVGSRRLR